MHDRRATDEADPAGYPPHVSFKTQPSTPTRTNPPDFDLDQKQRPRGSLFVELYNPWPTDGGKPAELYGAPAGSGVPQGVMLNRLSTIPDSVTNKKSPVWRMAVLYDPFTGKLANQVVDPRQPPSPAFPSPTEQASKQVLGTDPDGYGIDMDQNAERFVYFTTGDDYATQADKTDDRTNDESDPQRDDDDELSTDVPGGKADYQEDPVTKELVPEMDELNVWVPPLPIRWSTKPGSGSPILLPYPAAKRYFLARTERYLGASPTDDRDVSISPILPGRYAVIGSSGIQLDASGAASGIATRFVTTISQLIPNSIKTELGCIATAGPPGDSPY